MLDTPHYLERLSRLAPAQAALAVELARDSTAIHGFLQELPARGHPLPPSSRYALPLSQDATPPYLLVAEDGAAVTCLAPGMAPDVPIIPHHLVQDFAHALHAAMAGAVSLGGNAKPLTDQLVTSPHTLSTASFRALESAAPLLAQFLVECARHGMDALKTAQSTAKPSHAASLQLWQRYLTGTHAFLLGAPKVFSAQMVVLHSAAPDVYVSSRAAWSAVRRGQETLDVLEDLATQENLLGAEHELAVGVAWEQPLLEGRVRRFLKTHKSRQGAGYLSILEQALKSPEVALQVALHALLPLLPTILVPDEAAQDVHLQAPSLLAAQRAIPDARSLTPQVMAGRMHPRLAALLKAWQTPGPASLELWQVLMRRCLVRPNAIPFGSLLFARAPHAAMEPPALPHPEWSPEAGAEYVRTVLPAFSSRRAAATADPPGPNAPCHCGSGKKYKKCHMQEDEDRASSQR